MFKQQNLVILSLLLFASCEAFKEKSEIDPLFEPKRLSETMSQRNGLSSANGSSENLVTFKIKIPLAQDMIGHYDYAAIMKFDKESTERVGFIKKFFRNIKHRTYNLAIKLGVKNKVRISMDYEFPELDSSIIKSVKAKRIFFSLEQCMPHDYDCIALEKKDKLSVKILDSLFLNLSAIQSHDDMAYLDEPIQFPSKREFKRYEKKAFSGVNLLLDEEYKRDNPTDDSIYHDVTVASLSTKEITKHMKQKTAEQDKIFRFKVSKNHGQVKQFFEREEFKSVVRDVSIVGSTIYTELYAYNLKEKFFSIINNTGVDIINMGVDVFDSCTIERCVELNVPDMDLMPLIQKSNRIKFDTFLGLKRLKYGDFKYNGFVELEITLDLPF